MSEQIGQKLTNEEMSSSRKGDFAEMYAVTWLWDQGYEVFRNYGCVGMVDMIAWNQDTDEFILIDVKTAFKRESHSKELTRTHKRSKLQKEKGVRILKFNPSNRTLKFMEHKE